MNILEKNIENLTDLMMRIDKELEDIYTRAIYDGLSPKMFAKTIIDFFDEINEPIKDENIELRFQLKESRDKENVYLDMLVTIDESLKVFFKEEEENERFSFNDEIDYRECIVNLKKSLDEYKKVNKLRY